MKTILISIAVAVLVVCSILLIIGLAIVVMGANQMDADAVPWPVPRKEKEESRLPHSHGILSCSHEPVEVRRAAVHAQGEIVHAEQTDKHNSQVRH